ncbi:hypothetical protein D0T84_10870 [Dysgonomonas sp. 521]|nr:hypothetical protein [Dysgonomonas sp. 521]
MIPYGYKDNNTMVALVERKMERYFSATGDSGSYRFLYAVFRLNIVCSASRTKIPANFTAHRIST